MCGIIANAVNIDIHPRTSFCLCEHGLDKNKKILLLSFRTQEIKPVKIMNELGVRMPFALT
jgi:hypothetical protein